mmetsp:Transcript_42232/g.130408  ORF Transcript_42232/g.130408 Transcript_42232/m.130408 type:complete len:205 (+) Transcript_42232:287-901(+)
MVLLQRVLQLRLRLKKQVVLRPPFDHDARHLPALLLGLRGPVLPGVPHADAPRDLALDVAFVRALRLELPLPLRQQLLPEPRGDLSPHLGLRAVDALGTEHVLGPLVDDADHGRRLPPGVLDLGRLGVEPRLGALAARGEVRVPEVVDLRPEPPHPLDLLPRVARLGPHRGLLRLVLFLFARQLREPRLGHAPTMPCSCLAGRQ